MTCNDSRTSRSLRRVWVGIALSISAIAVGVAESDVAADPQRAPATDAAKEDGLLGQLQLHWSSRRGEIVTAEIRYRQILSVSKATLTPDQVAELVTTHDLVADPEQLRPLAVALLGKPSRRDPPWSSCRIVADGDSIRDEHGSFCLIRHGDLELIHDGDNDQTGVYPRGQSQRLITDPASFRSIPAETFTPETYVRDGGDSQTPRYRTVRGDSIAEFDASTGLKVHGRRLDPATGAILQESWWLGISQYADGIPFPTAVVEAFFQDNRLRNYRVRVVEAAEFNQPVSPVEFQSAINKGAAVLDYRGEEQAGYVQPAAADDLASTLGPSGEGIAPLPLQAAESQSRGLTWLFALNGLFLTLIGIYLWRRDRRRMEKLAELSDSESHHSQ